MLFDMHERKLTFVRLIIHSKNRNERHIKRSYLVRQIISALKKKKDISVTN